MESLTNPRVFFSPAVDRALAYLGIIGGILFLIAFGIVGVFRSAPFGLDFAVFHEAAVIFLQGGNPWQEMAEKGSAFAYPPHAASLMALYGLFSKNIALSFHTVLNCVSLIVIATLLNRWFFHVREISKIHLAQGAGIALFVGNPFMAHIVFEGQIALPAAACVMLSWHFWKSEHWIASGIFLGLATIKPQIVILYIVWLVFSFQIRILCVGVLMALVMLIPAFVMFGPIESFLHWFQSFEFYKSVPANMPGSVHVVGFESLLAAHGILGSGLVFKFLSVVSVYLLFHWKAYIHPALLVQLFFALSFTFIFGHDTGYAVIVGIFSMLLTLAMTGGFSWRLIPVGVVLLVFFFPQRFLREIPFPLLHHSRTLVVPIACWMVYYLMRRSGAQRSH